MKLNSTVNLRDSIKVLKCRLFDFKLERQYCIATWMHDSISSWADAPIATWMHDSGATIPIASKYPRRTTPSHLAATAAITSETALYSTTAAVVPTRCVCGKMPRSLPDTGLPGRLPLATCAVRLPATAYELPYGPFYPMEGMRLFFCSDTNR